MYNFYDEGLVQIDGKDAPFVIHYQKAQSTGITAQAHMHEYIEILYCDKGSYGIWINGVYSTFGVGDLVVINSMEMHKMTSLSDNGSAYICIRFIPEMLYSSSISAFDIKYVMPFLLNNSKHQRIFKKEEINSSIIPDLMYEILNESLNHDYAYELAIKASISRIFLWIVRYWHKLNVDLSNEQLPNKDMLEIIQKSLDFVAQNYYDDIKASEVAKMCNLSYSYFSRIFKQYMKKSFSEYVTYIRITNAEKLLVSTDMPITTIASECGFATSSYFIKLFHQYKGMSPSQFRKSAVK